MCVYRYSINQFRHVKPNLNCELCAWAGLYDMTRIHHSITIICVYNKLNHFLKIFSLLFWVLPMGSLYCNKLQFIIQLIQFCEILIGSWGESNNQKMHSLCTKIRNLSIKWNFCSRLYTVANIHTPFLYKNSEVVKSLNRLKTPTQLLEQKWNSLRSYIYIPSLATFVAIIRTHTSKQ